MNSGSNPNRLDSNINSAPDTYHYDYFVQEEDIPSVPFDYTNKERVTNLRIDEPDQKKFKNKFYLGSNNIHFYTFFVVD